MQRVLMSRRNFLGTLAAGGSALFAHGQVATAIQASFQHALDAARAQAARRRRRVIFNNDGDDIWAPGADTAEQFLALRHLPLLHTHVDSIFYCTTQSFNLFTHATSTAEVFTSREGGFASNNLPHFLAQGTDGLRMSVEFAHQHGLESIWTLRMNDIHDAWTPQFVSQWKRADPRRVMSSLEAAQHFDDRRRLWSLVDFEHPDVEPRLLAIIEEVLQNYPIDGVELDWLRAPIYFRSHYEGNPVSDGQVEGLTRLLAAIRRLVLRESLAQGKPFLLAVRVPMTTALCRRIGIDIAGWLAGGLVDFITLGGGYVVFDPPVAELISLAHQHGVPAYVCLSQSGLYYRPPRGNGEPQPVEAWFAAAQRMWEAGADGIYTFNLFPGPGDDAKRAYAVQILRTIGSLECLRARSRMFAISDAGSFMPSHYWAKDAEEYSHALPASLSTDGETQLTLVVAGPAEGVRAQLRLDFVDAGDEPPRVRFNEQALGHPPSREGVAQVQRFAWNVPQGCVRAGENALAVGPAPAGCQLAGAELWLIPS